jgi:hypothetical protein
LHDKNPINVIITTVIPANRIVKGAGGPEKRGGTMVALLIEAFISTFGNVLDRKKKPLP